jgi:TonB family protein
MKTIFKIFIMLTVVAVFQGCLSKEDKNKYAAINKENADASVSATTQAEARATKKKQIEKQTAERAAARELARTEKLKASMTYKDANGRLVYNKAEVDPSYSGGTDEMREFLKKNLKYPEVAKEQGFEGTVFVDFVVDDKGRVREVMATDVVGEDVDLSLKEESVRVVASMPLWKPGTQHGKAVDTSFSIPITFEINE